MAFREDVMRCLGSMPGSCDLEPTLIGARDRGDHDLRLVSYHTEPGEQVMAYVLVPHGASSSNRLPAIVAAHQHAGAFHLGKSEPAGLSAATMYHYGLDLCRRGYVVICPDHLGFEDRRPPEFVRTENPALNAANYERFLFTSMILKGTTLRAKYLWDLTRAVDYLQAMDCVDAQRIGAIGHSLGGQETLWLTWFDHRIKVGVSSCGFSQLAAIVRDGINHNFAAYPFGFLAIGDVGDIVCDLAPRPFMMTNGTADAIFPLDGVREIAAQATAAYGADAQRFRSIVFDGEHSFPDAVKQEAYRWLDRHLYIRET